MQIKNLAVALALTLFFSPAKAEEITDGMMDMCVEMSLLATKIMKVRQAGAPMDLMLKTIRESKGYELIGDVSNELVVLAYKAPAYSTEAMKKKQTTEFGAQALIKCLEAME